MATLIPTTFLIALGADAAVVSPPSVPVTSPPLRSISTGDETGEIRTIIRNYEVPQKARPAGAPVPLDPVVQTLDLGLAHSPDVVVANFEGVSAFGSAPPDSTGAVGPNHYVEFVNTRFAIYDKSGHTLFGPARGKVLFQSLGGTCATHNDGDPIVKYDQLADRWILTQFAVFATDGSASHQCVAVSMTGDPLGSYYLYDFRTADKTDPPDADVFVDYPHWGVWPDGYYMASHQFGSDGGFAQGLYVFERANMLAGLPARFQFHNFGESVPPFFVFGGAMVADLDGLTPPPAGAPAYVVQHGSPDTDGSAAFVMHVWQVRTTWGNVPSLAVTGPVDALVAPFNAELCTPFLGVGIALGARPCVPQPAPDATPLDWLDGIGDRLMYRVPYRNFGDHEALLINHTVNASGHQAGVRWYELRNPSGTPATIFQQGTYTGPVPDAEHRWMGSLAMDNSGNIALGYSKSSLTLLPEIDIAGRMPSDPPGILGGEVLIKASGGVQTDTGNRWGDYTTMTVDPRDGCSFWYINQYIPQTGTFNWGTRIGSVRYSSCTAPPQGVITGRVTDCVTGAPMSRALVQVSNGFSGGTDPSGRYSITLPPGDYTVSASADGRLCAPSQSVNVSVSDGGTTARDFCLTGSPKLEFASSSIDDSGGSNNGIVNKDECVKLSVGLVNNGCGVATGVKGTLSTSTPGVTINQPAASFGTIGRDASATNSTPFSFSTSSANGFRCGAPIDFTLALSSDQSGNSIQFSVPTCQGAPSQSRSGSITTSDSIQNARMGRDSSPSGCEADKGCPGPLGSGNRHFDAYPFTNDAQVSACIRVDVTANASCSGGNQIFSVAYLDSYDPQNLCTNYLADEGQSPDLGFNSYSFEVPPGRNFVVVVDSIQPDGTFTGCPSYSLNVSGFIDNTTTGGGSCPPPPVVTCLEDTDSQISYGNGWHLINDANASGGHFRMNASSNLGPAARLPFTVPAGATGALTYNFARSPRGGSADVFIDDVLRETISFAGSGGTMKAPQFGFNSHYGSLAAGAHTFELRNIIGVVYVDGFCLESAFSKAQATAGPGPTTTASGSAPAGQPMLMSVAVPPGAQALSVVSESGAGLKLQLVVIGPTGLVVGSTTSTSGLTVMDMPLSQSGIYTVQAVNLSAGPVSIWTAATPLLSR